MPQKQYLWVGLGNPGRKYINTRHNAGASLLVAAAGMSFKGKRKLQADLAEKTVDGIKHILLLPVSYMNLSGGPVKKALDFYSIPTGQMIVLHDELELKPGELKIKTGGGHRGHNGLRDIIAHCGGPDFHRVRIGIGRPQHSDVAGYVLSPAGKDELLAGPAELKAALEAASMPVFF